MSDAKPLVVLRGPVLSISGYGVHCRQIAGWLLSLERAGTIDLVCEPLPWGNTSWIVDQERDDVVRELMPKCKPLPRQPDVSVQLQLPNEWNPKLASRLNVGVTAAVETDVAPKEWVAACAAMDAVVFPSEHSKRSLLTAGWDPSPARALVVPESFPDELLSSAKVGVHDTVGDLPAFTFLVFGQVTAENSRCERKGVQDAVRWLSEEFVDDPEVGVLVKANVGRATTFDAYHTANILSNVRKEAAAKTGKKKLPKLFLVHGDMRDDELSELYRHPNVKALVAPTHGEGFGLPLLEAAACDLPVIATAWSAHVEFLGLGKYVDLPCTLKPVPKEKVDGRIFVEGARWAEVSEQDFKRRLRKFRTSSSIPRGWAVELGRTIREKYSREAVAKLWEEALGSRVRGG